MGLVLIDRSASVGVQGGFRCETPCWPGLLTISDARQTALPFVAARPTRDNPVYHVLSAWYVPSMPNHHPLMARPYQV